MAKKNKVEKNREVEQNKQKGLNERYSITLKDFEILKKKVTGKDKNNGISLVFANISYPHINTNSDLNISEWFNVYFEKISQGCKDFVTGELTEKAAVEYEKSNNPRKRFCPRIYNYTLECKIESGLADNVCIAFKSKLIMVEGNILVAENTKEIFINLNNMRIIKKHH